MCIWAICRQETAPQLTVSNNDRANRLVRFGAFIITTVAATSIWQAKMAYQTSRRRKIILLGMTLTLKQAVFALTAASVILAICAIFLLFSLYKDIRPTLRTILPLG